MPGPFSAGTEAPGRPPDEAAPAEVPAGTPDAETDEGTHDDAGDDTGALHLSFQMRKSLRMLTAAGVGLFALAFFYTLYFASGFFLPVTIALVLNLLFRPVVRALKGVGLPEPLGAALVMLVVLGAFGYSVYELSGPASRWAEQAPVYLRQAEAELRGLFESMQSVGQSAEEVSEQISGSAETQTRSVQVQQPSVAGVLLSQTRQLVVAAAIVFFLLYFLLASGDLFLRKVVHVVPLFRQKRIAVQIAHSAEHDLSTYLATYAVINATLGTVVGTVLYLLGMPNPVLWGVMVALLNFVPYLGAAVGVCIVALVAFVSIESTGRAVAAPLLYFAINSLEGNLITPLILGQRLQLNPVAIFISLTFWGWIWGVPGALLATPLLVSLKVICDNVITLRPLGAFIGR